MAGNSFLGVVDLASDGPNALLPDHHSILNLVALLHHHLASWGVFRGGARVKLPLLSESIVWDSDRAVGGGERAAISNFVMRLKFPFPPLRGWRENFDRHSNFGLRLWDSCNVFRFSKFFTFTATLTVPQLPLQLGWAALLSKNRFSRWKNRGVWVKGMSPLGCPAN